MGHSFRSNTGFYCSFRYEESTCFLEREARVHLTPIVDEQYAPPKNLIEGRAA